MLADRDAWLRFYDGLGLATLPLRPRAKRPLRTGWQTPSKKSWNHAPPDANVGILCGAASGGLVVLDFDSAGGPREALGMRPEELAVHTLVVKTRRGWHVYARDPNVSTCSPSPGLDIRAGGSLVVAPPSIHPSGVTYELVGAGRRITPLGELPLDLSAGDTPPPAPDLARAEGWIKMQAPKLQAVWSSLRSPTGEFDRSSADFAVSRCLWEAGFDVDEIAAVLTSLPGSKAHERGLAYARRTAARAASRPSRRQA